MGLSLISWISGTRSICFKIAFLIYPFAALALVISSFLEPGIAPAILASLWLIVTGLIGLEGLIGLHGPRGSDLPFIANLSLLAGMIYLPVGAVWLLMSRLGIQPLGFGDTIVLLTAVHFHFAGFAAPLLTGITGWHLGPGSRVHNLLVFAVGCVIAGTPLVAAGITFSPLAALVGAVVVSLGLGFLALLNILWVAPTFTQHLSQVLLIVSAVANVPAMALAIAYAYSIVSHKLIVDIPQMAMTHGVANAFGFALCGLAAWVMIAQQQLRKVNNAARWPNSQS